MPSLLVGDLDATLEFYRRLGFRVSGVDPDRAAPSWAEVTRDGVVIQFYTDPPVGTPTAPTMSGTLYLETDDVAALAAELGNSVAFAWGPEIMDYGMHEFGIRDPDGYLIAFTQPA